MIRAAVIGSAGYTGGELLRLLSQHPHIATVYPISESQVGKMVGSVHDDLFYRQDWLFLDKVPKTGADVYFLCGGHGASPSLLEAHALNPAVDRVIDLSQDFRLPGTHKDFIYGLPEAFGPRIREGQSVANPGCFATAIQLALLPLAQAQSLQDSIHVTGITGATGAGQKPQESSHFAWRTQNISVYKAFEHQHLPEIRASLSQMQENFSEELLFIPMRGGFARGILCSLHTRINLTLEKVQTLYRDFYANAPFVHLAEGEIHLKQVVNTNHALLSVGKHDDYLHITVCIDNLLKGASGQAVQNMNLLFGRPETEGLHLKSIVF